MGTEVQFVATYNDGAKKDCAYTLDNAWLVLLDSLPAYKS